MVLHVCGNHRYACILGSVDSALALAEDDGGLKHVLVFLHNHRGLLPLGLSELATQVFNGTTVAGQGVLLVVVGHAQPVYPVVKLVDLSLIAQLSQFEIVGSVAVAKLIVGSHEQPYGRIVDVELRPSANIERVSDVWLDIELPCLVGTEVKGEVDAQLRGKVVAVVHIGATGAEGVPPAQAVDPDHLEEARLALISAKPVAEVCRTQQREVQPLHERAEGALQATLVVEINLALNSEAKDRGEIPPYPKPRRGVEVLEDRSMRGLGVKPCVHSYVPVVEKLAALNGLGRCRLRNHCGCRKQKQ